MYPRHVQSISKRIQLKYTRALRIVIHIILWTRVIFYKIFQFYKISWFTMVGLAMLRFLDQLCLPVNLVMLGDMLPILLFST